MHFVATSLTLQQMADVTDEDVHKLEKKYKEGIDVRARILGYRHLEGLAMGTLKVCFDPLVFVVLIHFYTN